MHRVNCWLTRDTDTPNFRVELEWCGHDSKRDCGINALSETSEILLQDQAFPLAEILGWLDSFARKRLEDHLREDGMYAVGHYLYQQTLGRHRHHADFPAEQLELHIISDDEFIHRLPWPMLSRNDMPLYHTWSVSLSRLTPVKKVIFPNLPVILIIAPEPGAVVNDDNTVVAAPTHAKSHIANIRKHLERHSAAYRQDRQLRVVHNWDSLQKALSEQAFDVLYYYGHGKGLGGYASRLLLESGTSHLAEEKTFQDLRQELITAANRHGRPPALCYINACHGSSGGRMGAGWQLGHECYAVVSNRTAAITTMAMQQGEAFLDQLIGRELPPDEALRAALRDVDSTSGDIRWVTPLLHRQYSRWVPAEKKPRYFLDKQDPHWEYMLDRITQSGTLQGEIRQMVNHNHPGTALFIWYGCHNVGVDLFHQRVPLDIHELRLNAQSLAVSMDWPAHTLYGSLTPAVFEDNLLQCMRNIETLHIRTPVNLHTLGSFLQQLTGQSGQKILLHLRLQTLRDDGNPEDVVHFLEWWQTTVNPILTAHRIQTLMTLGIEVSEPDGVEEAFNEWLEPLNNQYNNLSVDLLPQLPLLSERDLRKFMRRFFSSLPAARVREEIKLIMKTAAGNYQKTIDLLSDLNNRIAIGTQVSPGSPAKPTRFGRR